MSINIVEYSGSPQYSEYSSLLSFRIPVLRVLTFYSTRVYSELGVMEGYGRYGVIRSRNRSRCSPYLMQEQIPLAVVSLLVLRSKLEGNNQSTGGNDDDEINATVDAAVNDKYLKKY
jgi:hypothetical protein